MSFLAFGGFVARLLGADNGSARPQEYPQPDRYAPISQQFDSMNLTADRIVDKVKRIEFHTENQRKIQKIFDRIGRIQLHMQTNDFKDMNREFPGTEEKMLEQIESLRQEARRLLSYRHL